MTSTLPFIYWCGQLVNLLKSWERWNCSFKNSKLFYYPLFFVLKHKKFHKVDAYQALCFQNISCSFNPFLEHNSFLSQVKVALSIRAVFSWVSANWNALIQPAGPAPIITMSKFKIKLLIMSYLWAIGKKTASTLILTIRNFFYPKMLSKEINNW
jgi:hypothetical protein